MKAFRQNPEELEEFINFMEDDLKNVERVLGELIDEEVEFMVHAKSETVEESAKNTDMSEGNIIKTLIFIGENPVAVLCPGDTSVSENKLEEIIGSEVRMARPEEVKETTGYIVGGVSPFNLDIPVYASEKIPEGEVRPAGGSRVIGVKIDREELFEVVGPEVVGITE